MRACRKPLRWAVWPGLVLAILCVLHPIHNRVTQLGGIVGAGLVWLWLLACLQQHRGWRGLVASLPLWFIVPFLLPERPVDRQWLRDRFLDRIVHYQDSRYLWGGEGALGIDCSGLPRRALRDALWAEGWRNANGAAFRMWLDLWWFDSSAKAIADGHRGRTKPAGIGGPSWDLPHTSIQPGDLAIRSDGRHVIVYLGNGEWIEADPTRGKVHRWVSSPQDGVWYEPMVVFRWTIFGPAS